MPPADTSADYLFRAAMDIHWEQRVSSAALLAISQGCGEDDFVERARREYGLMLVERQMRAMHIKRDDEKRCANDHADPPDAPPTKGPTEMSYAKRLARKAINAAVTKLASVPVEAAINGAIERVARRVETMRGDEVAARIRKLASAPKARP